MPGVQVKKEPEDIPSTSHQDQTQILSPQPQTMSLSIGPNQVTHHLMEGPTNGNGQATTHIVTQHDSTDLPASMQIAQVQGLPTGTHQLTLSNLNQVGSTPGENVSLLTKENLEKKRGPL